MQIRLFNDKNIIENLEKKSGKVKQRAFTFAGKEEILMKYAEKVYSNKEDRKNFLSLKVYDRLYKKNALGVDLDSHFEYEMLGLSLTSSAFCYTISLEDHLDLVLHCLTGCDMKKVREIEDYEKISRAIINVDLDNLDISLNKFFDIDDKLNNYLETLFSSTDNEIDCIKGFFINISQKAQDILKYIGFYLQGKSIGKVLSFHFGKIIITCKGYFGEPLEIYEDDNKLMDLKMENRKLMYL